MILMNSLYTTLIGRIQVQMNFQNAKAYLHRIGFENIMIQCGNCIHNGRKNVFMLKAMKI
jgi:hypothetical protein